MDAKADLVTGNEGEDVSHRMKAKDLVRTDDDQQAKCVQQLSHCDSYG